MADKKISALTGAATPLAGTEVLPIVQSGATVKATVANIVGAGTSPGSFTSLAATGAATTGKLTVQRTGVPTQYIEIIAANSGAYNQIKSPGVQAGGWQFRNVADNGSSFEFTNAGDASLPGNFAFVTAAKGVNFTANTPKAGMTSQLLNWYEEGTWTPVPSGITVNSGTPVYTGYYTRIGRSVTITWSMSGGSITTVAGTSKLTGMPFARAINSIGSFMNELSYASGPMQTGGGATEVTLCAAITGSYFNGSITYFA